MCRFREKFLARIELARALSTPEKNLEEGHPGHMAPSRGVARHLRQLAAAEVFARCPETGVVDIFPLAPILPLGIS
jgi:hypothetical protein